MRWFPPIFFSQHRIKLLFWDIDGSTPTHSPKSGCQCHIDGATPSYLARTWPKNSGALLGADLGRKRARFFGQTWAQHRLNIEGYVGPLGALLAAFGPKIPTPTEAWLRWGWILGRFRAQNRLKTSCAIYLLILKYVGWFFFNWRNSFYVPAKIAPFSFSPRGVILWVFWFWSCAIYF